LEGFSNVDDESGQWGISGSTTLQTADPQPSTTMAIWSLVLSAIPLPLLWPVAIGLGIAVLVRSKDGRNHGKTLVFVGFSIIGAWLVVVAGLVALGFLVEMAETNRSTGSGTVRGDVWIEDVRVGDCLADELENEVTLVELVSCNSSHRLETYAVFELPAGVFPGQDDVDRLSEGGCAKRFENFVGLPYDDSELEFQFVTPVEDSWADDRSVLCMVDTGGPTTGTLKGAHR
jgi:hypothetical protein